MEIRYIQAPYIPQPIVTIKGKVPRVKPAKRKDVPLMYRKSIWLLVCNRFNKHTKYERK